MVDSTTYKCKECGEKVAFTGRRQEIIWNGQSLGEGLVLRCSKCERKYFALKGQWFEDTLVKIERLDLFNDNE